MNKSSDSSTSEPKKRSGSFIRPKNKNASLSSSFIQPKLTIGKSNDAYEQEADAVANKVLNMSDSNVQVKNSTNSHINKKSENPEEELVQKKSIATNISSFIQPSGGNQSKNDVSPAFKSKLNNSKGGGSKMDTSTQSYMESRFGTDFSNVRIHTNNNAIQMNKEIGARAFTNGSDIYFNRGTYNPSATSGKFLLAHELTHTVQQNKAQSSGTNVQKQSNKTSSNIIQRDVDWTEDEIKAVQRELRRLGLYVMTIDGDFGGGTRSGLVEAYGGDAWQNLPVQTIISDLQGATPPSGTAGEHNLLYGEMFKDGILDFTIGIGYDEGNWHLGQITAIEQALIARGFSEPSGMSELITAMLLYAQAGRTYPESGTVYIKEDALTYTPPVGAPRQIHAIVRFVNSPDGSGGAEAAEGFHEGMVQSDVALYGGHGRYGTGPDFDRNMTFDLLDEDGNVTQTIDDYHALETLLEGESSSRTAWQQFLWRHRNNRITVHGSNSGNVYLNNRNPHSSEFGANIMYWNMQHNGAQLATGESGTLNNDIAANPDRRYRLWVFDGCRTRDYERSIRATPNIDDRSTDVMLSRRTLYWSDIATTLIASLDAIINQSSAEQIITDMDAVNTTNNADLSRRSFDGDGISNNPIIR